MGAGWRESDGLVAFTDWDGVIQAGFVRTGRCWRNLQIAKKAGALLCDSFVALDSRFFPADAAIYAGNPNSVRGYFVAILERILAKKRTPSLYSISRYNSIVGTGWILAEVDLNPISFYRDSGWLFCGRIYAGNDNAL